MVPVLIDPVDRSPYIVFRFRRYNLEGNRFSPGYLDKFTHVNDIVNADSPHGLSTSEVKENRQIVGDNHIPMRKPKFLRTLRKEMSKPFYTYQLFMIWSVSLPSRLVTSSYHTR